MTKKEITAIIESLGPSPWKNTAALQELNEELYDAVWDEIFNILRDRNTNAKSKKLQNAA